ncbi:hypothetical protein FOCC_FOCC001286 [Frankliniella occidentalis]|uniref:Uncharacterized protein LOC113210074 n=1 Tax=Frankliniella occidentalis TaxID=133901 RepID=A0A6J1SS70_FRAOC|nr:uncharacterized protein LOC113210074 [Frankliniella occidentalis]KAE8752124.1 hypothetical protein FOCC_FOCC001286 [Frankliniella occidentalis]
MESNVERDNPIKFARGSYFQQLSPMTIGPIWQTPLTDLTAGIVTAQEGPQMCAQMELMMLNCMEQYGYMRGMKMCGGYIQDLHECQMKDFERTRVQIMQEERRRQFRDGKLTKQFEECPPHL